MFKDLLESILIKFNLQTDHTTGALMDIDDIRSIAVASYTPISKELKLKHFIDISKVPVQDQKNNGSCVGQAVGGEDDVLRQGEESSKRYLYGECKKIDGINGEGTYPLLAYRHACKTGIARAKVVPNDNFLSHKNYTEYPYQEEARKSASDNLGVGFATLDPESYFMRLKLLENRPIGVTMMVDDKAWRVTSNGKLGKVKKVDYNKLHRVYIYGYEREKKDVRFYFRNSWGKNWGNNGNGSFLFEDYKDYLFDLKVFDKIPQELLDEARNTKYFFTKELKLGDDGAEVIELQKRLKELGYFQHPNFTGYYGDMTALAVLNFQLANSVDDPAILKTLKGHNFGPKTIKIMNGKDLKINEPINYGDMSDLVKALIQVESGGKDDAIGDLHLIDKAFGVLQIRRPYVDDINRVYGSTYKAEDCLNNRQLSIDLFYKYMSIYITEKRLGRPPRYEDYARAHNGGGPSGWKNYSTIKYWEKVKKYLVT